MIQNEHAAGSGRNPQQKAQTPPSYLPARTGERIAGISCPRRGQQVPKGLGHFQTGRLRRPSGPHNQPVAVKNDSPGRAARYLLQQQDDTCWHFPDTFLTLFTYLRKRYQSVCQSVLSAKRRLADTLTLFFEKTFFLVQTCSPFHSCSALLCKDNTFYWKIQIVDALLSSRSTFSVFPPTCLYIFSIPSLMFLWPSSESVLDRI